MASVRKWCVSFCRLLLWVFMFRVRVCMFRVWVFMLWVRVFMFRVRVFRCWLRVLMFRARVFFCGLRVFVLGFGLVGLLLSVPVREGRQYCKFWTCRAGLCI